MEVIYPTNSITAKQKNQLETLLMTFSIMCRIMVVGQNALIIAIEIANGLLIVSHFCCLHPKDGYFSNDV